MVIWLESITSWNVGYGSLIQCSLSNPPSYYDDRYLEWFDPQMKIFIITSHVKFLLYHRNVAPKVFLLRVKKLFREMQINWNDGMKWKVRLPWNLDSLVCLKTWFCRWVCYYGLPMMTWDRCYFIFLWKRFDSNL